METIIITGYCVEGTLAKQILSEPEEIVTLSGQKLPLKMSVDYISFSAHTDYQQTSEFIRALKPPHVVSFHAFIGCWSGTVTCHYNHFDLQIDRSWCTASKTK